MARDVMEAIRRAEDVIEKMTPRSHREYDYYGNWVKRLRAEGFREKYGEYREIWPFSNEPLKDIYRNKNLRGKRVLTVAGSGDHALSAALCGARDIDTFDINKLTEYFILLKCAAIEGLSFGEFCEFFDFDYKMNPNVMLRLYERIESRLSEDVRTFWNCFYTSEKIAGFEYLFMHHQDMESDRVAGHIPYMEEEKFSELKRCIGDVQISFVASSLGNLTKHIVKSYDHMNFSNILTWDNCVNKQRIQAVNDLKASLNAGGDIYCAYYPIFHTSHDVTYGYVGPLDAETRMIHNSIETLDGAKTSKLLVYTKPK